MNKLRGMKTYLIGCMDRVPDGGIAWRNYITPYLNSFGVGVFNPCNKPVDKAFEGDQKRELLNCLINNNEFDRVSYLVKEFRVIDLRFCDLSDFLVCYLDPAVHTCGSYEEIFLANRQKKPILIVCDNFKHNLPLWLWGTLPWQFFFNNWSDMLSYLDGINSGNIEDVTDRWVFINYERLIK